MTASWVMGRRTRGRRRSVHPAARPVVEALEGRVVLDAAALPDIAMVSITTADSRSVSVTYQINNAPVAQPFQITIECSADGQADATAVTVAEQVVSGDGLTVGTHQVTIPVAGGLPIDPAHPYVLAVANADGAVAESNASNDVAAFRVYVIGAVTHGLEYTPGLPAWVTQMAASLRADGYDVAIPFDWSQESRVASPGLAVAAGAQLAAQIEAAVQSLPAGSVVDLHLIGHSRGAVVIDQAMLDLQELEFSGQHPELDGLEAGWTRMTFLDPHPARNVAAPGNFLSASNGPLGRLVTRFATEFQSAADDPPIVVPNGVQQAEVYFQHAKFNTAPDPTEQILNFWGDVPLVGAAQYGDLTGVVNGHSEVYEWYQQNVVPGLKTSAPFVAPPAATTPVKAHAARNGKAYEVGVLGEIGIAPGVARTALGDVAQADRAFARGDNLGGLLALEKLVGYLGKQPPKKVNPAALALLETVVGTFAPTGV